MLDDKLREIRVWSGVDGQEDIFDTLSDSAIDEIKQVFADEREKEPGYTARDLGLMTGQEWYDRFEKEYANLGGGVPREKAFEAAKKAAGL